MARVELTLDQVRKNAASFMYVFVGDGYLAQLNNTYAEKIRTKRKGEISVLKLSADKFETTYDAYKNAVKQGFVETYGMEPKTALEKLALGENVAGKNWKAGVFGVGSIGANSTEFKGTGVSVNPSNGYMMVGGQYKPVTDEVYDTTNGDSAGVYQRFWRYDDGGAGTVTYMSQYDKKTGKWYAAEYSNSFGTRWNAKGENMEFSDASTVWQNINFDWDDLYSIMQKIIDWIVSLFGGNSTNAQDANDLRNPSTWQPSQTKDGFVYESGIDWLPIALIGGGALIASMSGRGVLANSKKKK